MRSMRQWFALAVMAVSGLCSFTWAKEQPLNFKNQNADPTLSINDVSINEGNAGVTEVLFAVTLANPNGQTVTVDFQIVDGTATQGSDYSVISTSGTMNFFAGTTTQKVKVTINGDVVDEQNDETFFVNLLNATNATIADAQGVGTIINDDGLLAPAAPGNLTANATGFSTIALAWNDNSSDEDGFKIERKISNGNFSEVTTVGKDVNAFNDAGLSSGTSYVYRVRAYKGTANSGYSNEATASTSNSGLSPTLSVSDVSINEGNSGSTDVFFVVTVANPNAQTVSVDFQIIDGTATQGSDYSVISSSGTMTFLAGVKTQKIRVTINGDAVDEQRDETFLVNLLKVTNATITDNQGVGTIINDDGPPPPTAPSILTANTIGTSTIALVWSDNSNDEDGFKIERKTDSGDFSEIVTVAKDVTSYTDAGLSGGATYGYRVRAYKGTRNSSYSNVASAAIQTLPPAAPSGLTANVTSASTVSIAWNDNSSDEDGFKIERKTGSGIFIEINTVAHDIQSYEDTGLSAGTTYVYRVRAYRGALNSSYSNVISAKTPVLPPGAPDNLTAIATSASVITLAWSDNSSDELGFRIERKTGSDNFSVIITVGKDVHSYKNTGLSPSTNYVYRVRAYRGASNSSYSNEAAATTKLQPPAAPSSLTASVIGTSTISLAWSDNSSDEDGFKIERKTGSGTFSVIATVAKDVDSYDDAGLSAGTTYVYRIRAYKSALNSSYSNVASAKTPVLPPTAPSNLTASVPGTATVSLAWNDNSNDEDGFKIERRTSSGVFSMITTVAQNIHSYDDAGLSAGTTYIYRVRAYKGTLNSIYSNVASAKTQVPPPAAPGNLTAMPQGGTTISLAWSDNSSDEEGFKIERKTGSGGFSEIITTGKDIHSYNDTGLSAGATYVYRVRAYRGAVNSGYSNEAAATTPVPPPTAPSSFTASAASASTISLTWSDNSSEEDGFKIERKAGSGGFSEISAVGKDSESYLDINLSTGIAYVYRVRAFKGTLNSNYSAEVSVTIQVQPPMAPSNLTAIPQGGTTIFLAWNDNSSDEDGFKIERKTDNGNFSEIAIVGKDVKSHSDAGLSALSFYVYRVRAFKSFANSSYSNEATATIASAGNVNLALNKTVAASSTDPSRPVTAAVDGDQVSYWRSGTISGAASAWLRVDLGALMVVGKVVVAWKENYIATNYEVQISNDAVNWNAVHNATGNVGTQTLNFPQTTARYVRLFFTQNIKSNYRIIEFEVYSGAVAKRRDDAAAETRIPDELVLAQNYPNPFNPSTKISFSLPSRLAGARVTIKVYTVNGVEVHTLVDAHYAAGTHAVVFKPKNLPSGTYFYVMQAGSVRLVRQLMLVK